MTVFDCFLFCDELDTLEIRLATLAPVVDVFVLVEAPLTFAGRPKPLTYKKNAKRFKPWADKIRYVEAALTGDGLTRWPAEFQSRDAAMSALADAQPDDYVMWGDVDEIPHPAQVAARRMGANWQQFHRYYYNLASSEAHRNTIAMPYAEIVERGGMAHIRHDLFHLLASFGGGWHFSTTGDVVEHLKTRAHAELDTPEYHKAAREYRANLRDIIGRDFSLFKVGLDELPDYIAANADRFKDKLL